MRPPTLSASESRFLGVRLTEEELAVLDRFRRLRGASNRSEAVRELVRSVEGTGTSIEIPSTVLAVLESMVVDGWTSDLNQAVTMALTLGLDRMGETHEKLASQSRVAARDIAERRRAHRGADREGRDLLGQ